MSIGEGIGLSSESQMALATPLEKILGTEYGISSKKSSAAPKSNASMNYSSEKKYSNTGTASMANCAEFQNSFKALALDAPDMQPPIGQR